MRIPLVFMLLTVLSVPPTTARADQAETPPTPKPAGVSEDARRRP